MFALRFVGVVYCLSAVWCFFQLENSANALGLAFMGESGKLEYFSVYVGLQLGIGLAMVLTSLQSQLVLGAVFFSLIFSWVLTLARIYAIALYGGFPMMLALLILEASIAIGLYWQWRILRKKTC